MLNELLHARLRADLANQGAALSAMQSNQSAANTAAGLQLNAGQLLNQMGQDRQRMNTIDNAALEAIGQQQQQQAPQQAAAPAGPSVMDRLKQLNELKTAGLLTDEEFAAKKAELMKML